MQAGVYVRISRDRDGLAAGVQRQEADCRALAASRGWKVYDVYSDDDTSATDRRRVRKAYRRLITDLEAGRVQAVVAYSSSRLYRRARDLEDLISLIEQRRVEIATVVSGAIDLSTADGRMQARILASIDQGEAERIAERSMRAKADMKAEGRWLGGGSTAYAYERVVGEGGRVKHRLRQPEADILREMAHRAIAGESLTSLVRELNRRGLPASRGGRWQPSNLRVVLTSSFHAGMFPDGTPGKWPAVFTADQHLLLRALLPTGRGRGERVSRRYVLSGLAYCSECGRKLLGSDGAYRCMVRNGGCGRVRIVMWRTDEVVQKALMELPEPEPEPSPPPDDESLLTELEAVRARRLEAQQAFAAGRITAVDYQGAAQALNRHQGEVEARIRETAEVRIDFSKLTEAVTAEEWNEFAEEVIERVVVTPALRRGRKAVEDVPGRIEIHWKGQPPGDQ